MSLATASSARFVPSWMLEGIPKDVSLPVAARLVDGELRRLGRVQAELDLALGRGLEAMLGRKLFRELGHSRMKDCVEMRFGLSLPHATELRKISVALERLPLIRAAFLAGTLTRSKVRELITVATPEDEAGWVGFASQHSCREVASIVRATKRSGAAPPSAEAPEPEPEPLPEKHVRVSWTATQLEAAGYHWGLGMLRDVLGDEPPTWKLMEALAADTLARLGPGEAPDLDVVVTALARRSRRAALPLSERRLRELAALLTLQSQPSPLLVLPDPREATDAWEMHDRLVQLQRLGAALSCERAALLALVKHRNQAVHVSFASFSAYALSLGLSQQQVNEELQLDEVASMEPALRKAWQDGMSKQALLLVAAVASPKTAEEWLQFAKRATLKRLQLEHDWHQAALAALDQQYWELTGGRPRWDAAERATFLDWQEFFGIREAARLAYAPRCSREEADVKDFGHPVPFSENASLVTISFTAPEDVALLFRQAMSAQRAAVEAATGLRPSDGDCVYRMLTELSHSSMPVREAPAEARKILREQRLLERDGFRCSNPLCRSRRHLHEPHVVFRSRGGPDEAWNIKVYCAGCHQLIHLGLLEVTGTAPDDVLHRVGMLPGGSARETYVHGLRVESPALMAA